MSAAAPSPNNASPAPLGERRTAILVVHGMGSQRPTDTVRGVIAALNPEGGKFWVTPDRASTANLDLPVFTTGSGKAERRVDLHELYWAHLMADTHWNAVLLWLFECVKKGPHGLRWDLRAVWFLLTPILVSTVWSGCIIAVQLGLWATGRPSAGCVWDAVLPLLACAIITLVGMGRNGLIALAGVALVFEAIAGIAAAWSGLLPFRAGDAASLAAAFGFLAFFIGVNTWFLPAFIGDVARYYRDAPENVAVRRETRRLAVEAIRRLNCDVRYDRVIVVGHSLGTVIAYDALRAYWAMVCRDFRPVSYSGAFKTQDEVGVGQTATGQAPCSGGGPTVMNPEARKAWRQRSRDVLNALSPGLGWWITDFVTLASPLAHSAYLLAAPDSEPGAFDRMRCERELPQCPAWRRGTDGTMTFVDPRTNQRRFHHAALFALTRWTNLYFESRPILRGDMFAGPLALNYGQGIEDVPVSFDGKLPVIGHSKHWSLENGAASSHLVDLREAIDLEDGSLISQRAVRP